MIKASTSGPTVEDVEEELAVLPALGVELEVDRLASGRVLGGEGKLREDRNGEDLVVAGAPFRESANAPSTRREERTHLTMNWLARVKTWL